MMNRKEFLLAQVEKALNEGDERKCHILIDKLVSYHICPPDSYDRAFCPYHGECWWQWMMMLKEMLDIEKEEKRRIVNKKDGSY